MRKMLYALNMSLDGYMEGPNGELDWSVRDEELHRYFNDLMRQMAATLYGRRLYEIMSAHWPTAHINPSATGYEIEYAHIWQQLPKIVFSKTLEKVEWNSTLMREVNPDEIARLKAQPGEYMGVGGAELAAACMKLDLIDEFRLHIHPVVLGGGKPMFLPQKKPTNLEFMDMHTFGNGVVMLRYARAVP